MDKRGVGMVGAIVTMVIAGLIVSGIIYYGPSILSGIQSGTSGVLSVSAVVEHSNSYLDQQITVRGQIILSTGQNYLDNKFEGWVSEYTGDRLYHLRFENSPANVPIMQNSYYNFTGILRFSGGLTYLDVISVEPD